MTATGPLAGLRIVEFASFVAGPSAGMTLAQLGAEVIRVDPIGGNVDFHRWPISRRSDDSLYWTALNRGKRSVTLDVRSDEGRERLLDLATAPGADAGIILDNAVGRQWLDYGELRKRRADVISVRIEGRSDGGAAVDYTVNAEIGVPDLTGPADSADPVNSVLPAWDLIAGQQAVVAILAAVRRRDRTGEGSLVKIALADVATAAVAGMGWLTEATEVGDRGKHGNHLYGTFGVDFATSDGGRVMIAALTPRQWAALGDATGKAAALAAVADALDADFTTDESRYRHRDVIEAVLRGWFAERTTAQVRSALDGAGVLWGRYRTMGEAAGEFLTDPASNPVLVELDQPGIGPVISASSPIRFDDRYSGTRPAPALGADTDAVLDET
ncbi:CoA transferase [Gordonia sp. PDNC005]|uniref:CoA transferase n=1 Tax=unclassified Gordonia (in: high G+C Gram-positive bacteria) TaxID=2657482 RepID=UPI001966C228|nr:CoA transferase [Gordonia sp. PDNC005]QRY62189.1 CoA transferase [Gordonia sp. PDNC005]